MIILILGVMLLISAIIIVNLQMKVERLQAINDNCLLEIGFLGSKIRYTENRLQERENSNEKV
jgi:hypothetical protein